MENKVPFSVVRGIESKINSIKHTDGQVYFTTDTKKIYLDVNGQRISMGGNTGIYYGNAEQPDIAEEFFFQATEIEDGLIPNVKDIIINTDGCLYKVKEIRDTTIKAERLTLAGTGTGDGIVEKGKLNFSIKDFSSYKTILAGEKFGLELIFSAVDKDGNVTGPGRYEVYVNNVRKKSGALAQESTGKSNYVDLTDLFIMPDTYTLAIYAYGNVGTAGEVSSSLWITVNATEFTVEWNYDDNQINNLSKDFNMEWNISVEADEEANSYITIDDKYNYEIKDTKFTLTAEQLKELKIEHGAHKFELYSEAYIGNVLITSNKIIKNVMFWDDLSNEDPGFIINCNYFKTNVTQYDTIQIPVMIYHPDNNGTATIRFKVNGGQEDKASLINCKNFVYYPFSYTPDKSGLTLLQFICGTREAKIIIEVEPLDLTVEEVEGYEFKFKASDFANNEEIKSWSFINQDNAFKTIQFSENFDWINGGLKAGENDVGPYFKVSAGSYFTIPYKIFQEDLKNTGACFKIIFKASNCRDYDASVINCTTERQGYRPVIDENTGQEKVDPETGEVILEQVTIDLGLGLNAQSSTISSLSNELITQYCEDTYIEYEFDISKYSKNVEDQYLTVWLDGIPAGVVQFSSADSFSQLNNAKELKIGSEDCDVYIYLIKFYKKHLNSEEHLRNFIIDAPNSTEMMSRFTRNDILVEDKKKNKYISPYLLAEKNPECNVFIYELPQIPTFKLSEDKGKYVTGSYTQLKGSKNAIRHYDNVKVGAQGTSSMTYGISAYNLDTKFPEEWSMEDEAIPVNYYNTKVNVASCEGANNALNQEWYNKHQPYKTQKRLQQREDGKIARDTMQFWNGVVFIQDNNKETNSATATSNNIFKEISGYTDTPYPRMYSIGNMGNSKKNIEVFHGAGNKYECCVEVADNNTDAQRMLIIPGFFPEKEINGIQIPEHEISLSIPNEVFDEKGFVIPGVDWGTTVDPVLVEKGFTEEESKVSNIEMWKNSLIGEGFFEFRYCVDEDNFSTSQIANDFTSFEEYQIILSNNFLRLLRWFAINNPHNATNEQLPEPVTLEDYKIKGIKATAYSNYSEKEVLKGTVVPGGTFTHDTSEYRALKMLKESEEYLILDSILYHYIFIERHSMVDNVAKNTFWNTEDGVHWELTKNYDNDTADGIDNSGHLKLSYGTEIMDNYPNGKNIFNARSSSWLQFAHRLKPLREKMYEFLNNKQGEESWKAEPYLKMFENWQSVIPEICWIEDFNRKYFRPNNIYGDKSYLKRLANGKKTHQRKQYEVYQEQYTNSEYKTSSEEGALIQWRSGQSDEALNENGKYEIKANIKMYADGYVVAAIASGAGETAAVNIHKRGKKGEIIEISKEQGAPFNDATCYMYSPSLYQEITGIENLYPEYFTASAANKLRKISLIPQSPLQRNVLVESLSLGENIEEVIVKECVQANFEMNLANCNRLKVLDTTGSSFTGYTVADGAPLEEFKINNPTALILSNLYYLKKKKDDSQEDLFSIKAYNRLGNIEINNIDANNSITKEILEGMEGSSEEFFTYDLKNVLWNLDANSRVEDGQISLLEYIKEKGKAKEKKRKDSLTGIVNIPNSVYSGDNALDLYENYGLETADDSSFPKLELNFLNDDGTKKLYTVSIKNGDGECKWRRQFANYDSISNDDLNRSSLGKADLLDILKKSDDTEFTWTFDNKWSYTLSSGEKGYLEAGEEDQYYLDLSKIKKVVTEMTDIEIKPVHYSTTRTYTITFLDKETGKEIYRKEDATYGMVFDDIKPPIVPIKDDFNLAFDKTYQLKGYTTSATGSGLIAEKVWTVVADTVLYPVFEEVTVQQVDYLKYFDIEDQLAQVNGITNTYKVLKGIKQQNGESIYRGSKIVIPAEVEIIGEKSFADSSIQYVFTTKNSKLKKIESRAFGNESYKTKLKYFDFENCSNLISIGSNAFRNACLDGQYYTNGDIRLPYGLVEIGEYAFNNAVYTQNEIKIYVPSSVTTMKRLSIANWDNAYVPCSIYIGGEGDFSKLEFTINGTIKANDISGTKDIANIYFYTKKYTKQIIEENGYIYQIANINIINQ